MLGLSVYHNTNYNLIYHLKSWCIQNVFLLCYMLNPNHLFDKYKWLTVSALKVNASLGNDTILTVSPGFIKTAVTNIITLLCQFCQRAFCMSVC